MTRAALRRAVAATACAAVVAGPALTQLLRVDAAPGSCAGVRARADGWQALPAPAGFAEAGVVDYAVSTADPDVLYVTDGHRVAASTTGGCTWADVLDRDTLVLDDPAYVDVDRVTDVRVPPGPGGVDRVYALVEADIAGVRRTDVVVSADRGATWRSGGLGLSPLGGAATLAVSPVDPDTAYVVVDTAPLPQLATAPVIGGRALYSTADGGLTWSRRTALATDAAVDAVVPDPAAPDRLLARTPDGLSVSADGGATFAPAGVSGAVTDLVLSTSARGTTVLAPAADAPTLHRSADGGRSWSAVRLPAPAHSVAALDNLDLTAVAADGAVLLLAGDDLLDVTPRGGPAGGLTLVAAPSGPTVLARADGGLVRRSFGVRERQRTGAGALPRVDLHAAPAVVSGRPDLLPAHTDLLLAAGASQLVPYTLDLPAEPTPLDVFFLVDTTGSMGPTIEGLRRGLAEIVNDLADANIEAQFGVAEFKDYPASPWGGPGDTPYRLLRAIGPVDASLQKAIEELQASGGGDSPEAALPGLYQAVTGAGQPGSAATWIEPRRSAGFRPGALRVVVTVTDVGFHREDDYPGPSFAETVAALRSRDVRQVGLAVHGGGRGDLVEMAAATRTFAPATGLDCNGDGRRDLAPGAPLVCDVGDSAVLSLADNAVLDVLRPQIRIAPAVVALLRSVRDDAAVELQTLRPDISRVIGPARIEAVDGKRAHRLHFTVRYTCPADGKTNNAPAPLRAIRREEVLAEADGFLRCLPPLAVVEELLPPRALPPLAALLLLPPPPPPPAPVTNAQPNPNPNPNPNPQAQVNGQAGAAAVEQPEHELVVVDSREEQRHEDVQELAMSRRSQASDAPTAVALALASVVVCAGATLAFARRTTESPVRAR